MRNADFGFMRAILRLRRRNSGTVYNPPCAIRFGAFEADRRAYPASHSEVAPRSHTQSCSTCCSILLDGSGQLVTKEALLDAVWPGANVTENAMAQAISGPARSPLTTCGRADVHQDDCAARVSLHRPLTARGLKACQAGADGPVGPATANTTQPRQPRRAPLAVADFTNLAGDPEVDWLGAGIAETVTSDLRRTGRFQCHRPLARSEPRAALGDDRAPLPAERRGGGGVRGAGPVRWTSRALMPRSSSPAGYQRRGHADSRARPASSTPRRATPRPM
jgi:hypothetical protein